MTKGRRCPDKAKRAIIIRDLRARDGDNCCHCKLLIDFEISDSEHPAFPTLEHWPIKWEQCRSNATRFLMLAHRFCNERSELKIKADLGEMKPHKLARHARRWMKRAPHVAPFIAQIGGIDAQS